jgi:hypothetical protein
MDCADNVLTFGVVNGGVRKVLAKMLITDPLIGAEQADLVRDRLTDECLKCAALEVLNDAGNDVALATYSTDDRRLAGANAASTAALATLIPMPVLGEAADERFIDLDDAAKLLDVRDHGRPDLVAHGPRSFIGTEAHEAFHLKSGYALLAGYDKMHNAVPIAERLVRVFEHRTSNVRKPIASLRSALVALPTPGAIWQLVGVLGAASRAADAIWPAALHEIGAACVFVRKHRLEFCYRKLLDGLGLLVAHGFSPSIEGI